MQYLNLRWIPVLGMWLALISACSESCRSSVITRVQSPDGAYVAEVEDEICDSGRHSRYVYLQKNAAGNRLAADRILVMAPGAKRKVDLSWKSDGTVGLTIGLERVPITSYTVPKVIVILGVPVTITNS